MQVLTAAHVSSGMPSPTLTNPDMILPFEMPPAGDSSPLTPTQAQLSPGAMDDERHARSGSTDNQSRLKHPKQSLSPFRNGVLAHSDGPSMLRSNSERGHGRIKVENSRLSFRPNGEESIGTSPSPYDGGDSIAMGSLAESPEGEDGLAQNTYQTPSVLDEDEEDPESHAAMTRRAEEILANAKKRLTSMDRNLNRARSTLGSRPSSSMSSYADRDQPYQREKFSRLKHRQVKLTLKEDHQGHSRVFSETSVPSSLQSPTKSHAEHHNGDRSSEPGRNWFWNGLGRSTSVADKHSRGLQPLDEDGPALDSFEVQAIQEEDDEELQIAALERQAAASSDAMPQVSPTYGLSRSRSTNQMRDLREQMTDLKGKISTLKLRAREDSLRRRSLQSLRTPSPLNNAEQDYSKIPLAEIQNRGTGLDPIEQPQEPTRVPSNNHAEVSAPPRTSSLHARALQGDLRLDKDSGLGMPDRQLQPATTIDEQPTILESSEKAGNHQPEEQSREGQEDGNAEKDFQYMPEANNRMGSEGVDQTGIINDDNASEESEETEIFEEPVGERHEDRADAFDYEHFFLHSSMGHYGRKRGSTHSSNYSAETERPPTVVLDSGMEERDDSPNKHVRQNSNSSLSTVATFATATEGEGEGEGEGNQKEESEQEWTPRQTMAGTWLVDPPVVEVNGNNKKSAKAQTRKNADTKQEKSAKRHRREHSVTDDGVNAPVAEIPDLMTYLSAIQSKDATNPVALKLNDSDKELAERVMKSLAEVCLDLQGFGEEGGKYEARVCRRKLDTARRHLNGEVNGEAF